MDLRRPAGQQEQEDRKGQEGAHQTDNSEFPGGRHGASFECHGRNSPPCPRSGPPRTRNRGPAAGAPAPGWPPNWPARGNQATRPSPATPSIPSREPSPSSPAPPSPSPAGRCRRPPTSSRWAASSTWTRYAFRIDAGTGNLTREGGAIPAGPPSNRIFAFQATPAGDVLYVTGSFGDILGFDINPTTGAVTPKAGFSVATPDTALGGMQLDPVNSILYVTGFFGNSVLAYPVTTGGTWGPCCPGPPSRREAAPRCSWS